MDASDKITSATIDKKLREASALLTLAQNLHDGVRMPPGQERRDPMLLHHFEELGVRFAQGPLRLWSGDRRASSGAGFYVVAANAGGEWVRLGGTRGEALQAVLEGRETSGY